MHKYPRKPDLNVVPMPINSSQTRGPAHDFAAPAAAGGPSDPRTKEAMRLVEAFLAIEDATARASLIALAERLVSYDWLRKVQES